MEFTFIGVIMLVVGGAILLFGSLRAAFALLILAGIFSGSAAINLTALGEVAISPYHFALMFILLRILLPGGGYIGAVPEALSANRWLLLYAFYAIAGAFIGPRLFAGAVEVYPMSYNQARNLFDTVPLQPTAQNITQTVYMAGSLLAGLASYIVCRTRGAGDTLVTATLWVGWAHIFFGLLGVALQGTPADAFLDLFRNANYSQLSTEIGGFVRIRGLFPEASTYAGFAFAYFVLNAELWYRSIRPAATGRLAFALAVILFFSTSSSAYVALAGYLAFFLLRLMVFPRLADMSKVVTLALAIGGIIFVTAIVFILVPDLPAAVFDLVERMTVGKSDSDSARQRLFWAMQGWWVFQESYGLGIGIGSFRSSSFVTAMLGSVGVIGVGAFLIYLMQFFQPWKKSTWSGAPANGAALKDRTMGAALASAAFLSLIPPAVASADVQPGMFFAILGGAALALRPVREPVFVDEDEGHEDAYFQPVRGGGGTAPAE